MVFALGLGLAALFHLAGNPRPVFDPPTTALTLVQLAVGCVAVLVCLRPRARGPLLALCTLVPVSAWLEAPLVGNHWVLGAALSGTYLLAHVHHRRSFEQGAATATWARAVPAARLVLLVAYGMAAFAKLNTGFFDSVTSCAVFYQDQLVSSWGLGWASAVGRPGLGSVVAIAAASIELAVPVLLGVRRTRRAGVVLALSFHWLLALDLHQHFWDFSSVLFVAFLLFLDEDQHREVLATLRAARSGVRRSARLLLRTAGLLAAAVVTVSAALPAGSVLRSSAVLIGHASWVLLGTLVLVVVARTTLRTAPSPARLTCPTTLLLVVPLLVALNGVAPYLELKTGNAWNMYSNLRTVDGETNHLVVPATFDVTGLQADRVEILATSDDALAPLVGSGYAVVWSELQEYATANPEQSVTYRRDGRTRHLERIGDALAGPASISTVSRKLQPFRVVDTSGAERCQAVFSPAR